MTQYTCCTCVDTLCTLRGIWVDTFVATLLMAHAHELICDIMWYICVGTLRTLPGTWVGVFAATLLMVHMHEVVYMLVTELKTRGTENGNDGAHNPLQITLAVCFGSRPHGIAWPFSKDRCSQNTSRVAKKTLHAAAENVDFVRDLETRSYLCGYTSPRVSSFVAIFFPKFYCDGLWHEILCRIGTNRWHVETTNFALVSFKDSFGFERVPNAAERILLSNQ